MMGVFVVRDPSCSLVSTARPLVASSVPSCNSGKYSVVCTYGIDVLPWRYWAFRRLSIFWLRCLLRMGLLLVRGYVRRPMYCCMGLLVFQVFLEFFYWLALTFAIHAFTIYDGTVRERAFLCGNCKDYAAFCGPGRHMRFAECVPFDVSH